MKYVDRKHVKYHDMTEGEPRELPIGARRLEACCDCGLVHVHDYAVGEQDDPGTRLSRQPSNGATAAEDGARGQLD